MLPKWSKITNRSDKTKNKNHKVCDVHFKEEEGIEKEFIIKLLNETVEKVFRDRPKLKKCAIPCPF